MEVLVFKLVLSALLFDFEFTHMIPLFNLNSEGLVSQFLYLLQEDTRQKLVNSDNKVRQLEAQVSEAKQASANARKVNLFSFFVPAYMDKHMQIILNLTFDVLLSSKWKNLNMKLKD